VELLRLFQSGLSILYFDPAKLNSRGVIHTVDTAEGVKARNSMHNRLEADAFLPCGGRPNTIDITNYRQFFKADGTTPSAPLIAKSLEESTLLDLSPSVSFVQVCRNSLRLYEYYEYVTSQSMLKNLYESGSAFFTFPNCQDFDIVASIRYFHEGSVRFAPLLISVQACDAFIPSDANDICRDMETKFNEAGCHRALGLVIVIGSSVESKDESLILNTKDVIDLFDKDAFRRNMVIAKLLQVSMNDKFGIARAMVETKLDEQEEENWEIFASHSFVQAHVDDPMFRMGK
jgi:hypothetical protein